MDHADKKPNIQVRNLNITYNSGKSSEFRALDGISLDVYPQEYLIIFGPSGCGKSTLLYSIAGFQKPTLGDVLIEGVNINQLSERQQAEYHRRKVGMIFQAFYLIETLSVLDNVCLPKIFTEEEVRKREDEALGLLQRFGIGEQAKKFSSELSGGQKQRVAIARSLISNPDIILADEPVGNLDSKAAFNVMTILSELNERDKKTVILVTHDPTHIPYGDRVVYMKDGKIIKIEEVLEKKAPELKGEGWEVIKREPGEEIVKIKKAEGEKIYKISKKDGQEALYAKKGDRWELVRRETLSPEIAMLMRAFKNFSVAQLGMLFTPLKVQELLSHILFHMPDEDLEIIKKRMQDVLVGRIPLDNFQKQLDWDREKGGMGWDKRRAERFTQNLARIFSQVEKIDLHRIETSAQGLRDYMTGTFGLRFAGEELVKLERLIKERLNNKISVTEVQKTLDLPKQKGGLGLDKRVAFAIARELEILLLVKFSA